ncbi:MAG: Pterin binding enzyme [Candidatus Argoarchaeum ethanivorans]|uniref:Pterin binding enzyme n=1 Tax=Candidatus Argoarchaeum ethanivorans TaxID=2608793 RepID=A0A812A2N2_9EURY|nr:MAG: Pterin binding enzyme [Candidatus Argoarchaeum ethanivorans]
MSDTLDALSRIIQNAEEDGVGSDRIILDPAIGRWCKMRTTEHDLEIIKNFKRFTVFQKPLLAALSRKSFIGDVLGKPPGERLYGSIAATAIAVYMGANIVRTHDVAATVDAVRMALLLSHPCLGGISYRGARQKCGGLVIQNTGDSEAHNVDIRVDSDGLEMIGGKAHHHCHNLEKGKRVDGKTDTLSLDPITLRFGVPSVIEDTVFNITVTSSAMTKEV